MKKKLALLAVLAGLFVNAQSSWSLTGNSGTNPTSHFLGTTDNQDLVFKTNNIERIRINTGGNIAFGAVPSPIFNFLARGSVMFDIGESGTDFLIHNGSNEYEHLRIDGEKSIVFIQEDMGKVVIGSKTLANCSDCNQYKLFVKDGIRTEKIKVDIAASNGWADYVFAKDYKLMSLKELDKFINTNGHLPEVPTTEEAIKNGIELKEMNILLLKKIEELTLYTIEQQKRIEALENKIK